MPPLLRLSAAVADALAQGRPVVALESTIIAHGLPRPRNLEAARAFEAVLTDAGVTAATIAVVEGVPMIGLDDATLERIATDDDVAKLSTRDLPAALATRSTGATTVAATSTLAALAGIRVFATGGLGGVHREAAETFDESADLVALARTRITVVSAGVKSILDIPATLERLETLNIPVVGYRTHRFPSFWLSDSGLPVDWRVDSAEQVAAMMAASDALGLPGGIVVANPLPVEQQLDPALHAAVLAAALAEASACGLRGKAVSPFLLEYFHRHTEGVSLDVNIDIARNNVALAAEIATAWAARRDS